MYSGFGIVPKCKSSWKSKELNDCINEINGTESISKSMSAPSSTERALIQNESAEYSLSAFLICRSYIVIVTTGKVRVCSEPEPP